MNDEELITALRMRAESELCQAAADRIEELLRKNDNLFDLAQQEHSRAERLTEALALIESMTVHSGGEIHGVTIEHYRTVYEAMRQEASIALDEIGYGTAALTQKDRTND